MSQKNDSSTTIPRGYDSDFVPDSLNDETLVGMYIKHAAAALTVVTLEFRQRYVTQKSNFSDSVTKFYAPAGGGMLHASTLIQAAMTKEMTEEAFTFW